MHTAPHESSLINICKMINDRLCRNMFFFIFTLFFLYGLFLLLFCSKFMYFFVSFILCGSRWTVQVHTNTHTLTHSLNTDVIAADSMNNNTTKQTMANCHTRIKYTNRNKNMETSYAHIVAMPHGRAKLTLTDSANHQCACRESLHII